MIWIYELKGGNNFTITQNVFKTNKVTGFARWNFPHRNICLL